MRDATKRAKNPSQNKIGNHCFIMCYKQYIEGYDE